MPVDPALSEVLAAAGRKGAETSWRDLTPEQRADRTAAGRQAAINARRNARATRQDLAARVAAAAAAIPAMTAEESARQLRLLADLAEADLELERIKQRRKRRPTVDHADQKLAS